MALRNRKKAIELAISMIDQLSKSQCSQLECGCLSAKIEAVNEAYKLRKKGITYKELNQRRDAILAKLEAKISSCIGVAADKKGSNTP